MCRLSELQAYQAPINRISPLTGILNPAAGLWTAVLCVSHQLATSAAYFPARSVDPLIHVCGFVRHYSTTEDCKFVVICKMQIEMQLIRPRKQNSLFLIGMDFVHPDPCRPKVKPHPLIEELRKFLMPVSRDSRLELSKLRIHSSPGPSPIPTN